MTEYMRMLAKQMKGINPDAVVAVVNTECPYIMKEHDVPPESVREPYTQAIVKHLEALGCSSIVADANCTGYNTNIESDHFGTISHVIGFVPPPSTDIETLKGNLCTNNASARTGFYPLFVARASELL